MGSLADRLPKASSYQSVRLSNRWGLALFGKLFDDPLRYGSHSSSVLLQDDTHRRLDVNDLDAGIVVGKQVDPPSPGLPQEIGAIEGERSPCSKQFSASLPC